MRQRGTSEAASCEREIERAREGQIERKKEGGRERVTDREAPARKNPAPKRPSKQGAEVIRPSHLHGNVSPDSKQVRLSSYAKVYSVICDSG